MINGPVDLHAGVVSTTQDYLKAFLLFARLVEDRGGEWRVVLRTHK